MSYRNFTTVETFRGYAANKDVTKTPPSYLIDGSRDVLVKDRDRVESRKGFTLYGSEGSENSYITGSKDWYNSTGTILNLRVKDTSLELLINKETTPTWVEVFGGINQDNVYFDEWWDNGEAKDLLLFCDNTSSVFSWSGANALIGSVTTNTITLQDTSTTWAEQRFLVNADKNITINGTTYTYTGGEGTDTLTGVTPDPDAGGVTSGDLAIQSVKESSDIISANFNVSILRVLRNQLYVGDTTNRDVYISDNSDYSDFTVVDPRTPGSPEVLTLDSQPQAFIPGEDTMFISAGRDFIYQVSFTLSGDLSAESLDINRLKSATNQGALNQNLVADIKNSIIFVSYNKKLDSLGRVENIDTPQARPLSERIKNLFNTLDFTDGRIKYHEDNVYISVPLHGMVLIYNVADEVWQAPQYIPVQCFSVIDDEIYGHSKDRGETYKLFDGDSDNGDPINSVARFAYRQYGPRERLKAFDEWYTEGRIKPGTKVTCTLLYENEGVSGQASKIIDASNRDIIFSATTDDSIGKLSLGKKPIGSSTTSDDKLLKYRTIHTHKKNFFFEATVQYESNDTRQVWSVIAQGGNVDLAPSLPNNIKV